MAEQDYGKHDPRNHARDCTFHLDQYAFECDCGATARYERDPKLDTIRSVLRSAGTPKDEIEQQAEAMLAAINSPPAKQ